HQRVAAVTRRLAEIGDAGGRHRCQGEALIADVYIVVIEGVIDFQLVPVAFDLGPNRIAVQRGGIVGARRIGVVHPAVAIAVHIGDYRLEAGRPDLSGVDRGPRIPPLIFAPAGFFLDVEFGGGRLGDQIDRATGGVAAEQ